jgi:predicted RND superfamily exporter protein
MGGFGSLRRASMLIVASGFALFLLSDFPPTRRLGVLVCIGAVMTDLMVLVALPAVAMYGQRRAGGGVAPAGEAAR